jgi:vancomycin resistance protein YoaR
MDKMNDVPQAGEAAPDAPPAVVPEAPAPTAEPGPVIAPSAPSGRGHAVRRFATAFAFGALGVLAVSAGALAAFESSNTGRILPGVHVQAVDLSGLTGPEARARLMDSFGTLADGELVLEADGRIRTITYDSVGRRLDVDSIVERALAVGRAGATLERIASNVRNIVRGVELSPAATFEAPALQAEVQAFAAELEISPQDASVALDGEDFAVTPGRDGRTAGVDAAVRAAAALLADDKAPATVRVTMPLQTVAPEVTTDEATAAREAAVRIAQDIELVDGTESWTIEGASVRGWISFAASADGGYGPVVARAGLEAGLAAIAEDFAKAPVDASFLFGDGTQVVGVTEAKDGRALDIPGTVATLAKLVEQRTLGLSVSRVPLSATIVEPDLTTAEATQAAPLMEPISEWTTYFPIGIKNGQGANIWIPARDIDGAVVMPGDWFDFWAAIGPVTRERGYKDGGAIINGKTEPQGALAGGICSCSTTIFNAALRAGLEMGARRNHFYYIDRYPLGLDATVFQSSSGSIQTMTFRNDTDHPILIRGTGWKVGTKGYVKFVLWSVPTGRVVTFSTPIVKNVKPASDSVVYTTTLAPGKRERIEYPVDGKDVWVTRTVLDAAGTQIHQETYYSHYARITGIVQVGIAPDASPSPSPSPTPEPTPAP